MSRVTFKQFSDTYAVVQKGEQVEKGLGDFIKRTLSGGTDGLDEKTKVQEAPYKWNVEEAVNE